MKIFFLALLLVLILNTGVMAGQDITLSWSAIAASATNQPPTSDVQIFVPSNTSKISLTLDTKTVTNASSSVDINILGSSDCVHFDDGSNAYIMGAFAAQADNKINSVSVTPGVKCIKARLDNNDGGNTAGANLYIWIE